MPMYMIYAPYGDKLQNIDTLSPTKIARFRVLILQRVQARLTLFSKYFASFPHGTCGLSDSRRYLASDGIYHLIGAVVPNNATLRKLTVREFYT